MAANLTSLVMQLLTPEVIGRVASFLGLDRAATQKAAAGVVPALRRPVGPRRNPCRNKPTIQAAVPAASWFFYGSPAQR